MAAMRREMEGGNCEFLRHKKKLLLQFNGFGSRRTRSREANLHSHLEEEFALDWEFTRIAPSYGVFASPQSQIATDFASY